MKQKIMNSTILTNETGRSMVEMLGVLAIVGVLSVGGVYGYGVAMKKHKANELLHQASMLASSIAAQIASGKTDLALENFGNSSNGSFSSVKGPDGSSNYQSGDDKFTMQITGMDEAVCKQMQGMKGGTVRSVSCSAPDANGKVTATLAFNKDLSSTPVASDYTHTNCPDNFYKCDILSSCVSSEEKCRLDCKQGTWNNETQSCDCMEGYSGKLCEDKCGEDCQTCLAQEYYYWDTSDAAKEYSGGDGACCSLWTGTKCCDYGDAQYTQECCEIYGHWDTSDAAKNSGWGLSDKIGGACCPSWNGKACCNEYEKLNYWTGKVDPACGCPEGGSPSEDGSVCCSDSGEFAWNDEDTTYNKANRTCCEAAEYAWDEANELCCSSDQSQFCCDWGMRRWGATGGVLMSNGYCCQVSTTSKFSETAGCCMDDGLDRVEGVYTKGCCEAWEVNHWDTSPEAISAEWASDGITGACCYYSKWNGKACCDGEYNYWTGQPDPLCS